MADDQGAAPRSTVERRNLLRRLASVRQIEKLPMFFLASLAVLTFVFVQIAALVFSGNSRNFDEWLLRAMRAPGDNGGPIGPAWLEGTVRDFTALGSTGVVVLIVVISALFLLITRKGHSALYVVLAVVGGTLLNNLLKIGFGRPRPDIITHGTEVHTLSFPSGHSMMSAVVYLTLGMLLARSQPDPRVKIFIFSVCVLLTLMIGLSRIYLGVHWPTDVLAGWTLGAGWALLCWMLMLWLQGQGQVESDR
ncbi:Phosphoesterase PA-phosphatase related [Candidatus Filomicrobium marinum]|uniref:Phosphoesterase PA-phosphatase related n=1 Tax=Candidatus Filomicrobium marinum TaxID=1608628 RepID=A0A0D6JJ36_9HYPH|nr:MULTISPECIES: phosphatase PAP2 family protein [Filomicrobium]MCV0370850.1 phosphatase PAP2 family protein [Filomicrobium sp.]CFX31959.1 Phosphoesterase PA-phosphatase related [Candidatus Filomicrobium marinum]CPR21994.1 Phosphoesterase PA-phosphatase related [Candidatus Filomicrobium marinum]